MNGFNFVREQTTFLKFSRSDTLQTHVFELNGDNWNELFYRVTTCLPLTDSIQSIICVDTLEKYSSRFENKISIDFPLGEKAKGTPYESVKYSDLLNAHFLVVERLHKREIPSDSELTDMVINRKEFVDLPFYVIIRK